MLGSGPQKELPGCWAGAVAPGKGKERGQRASRRKLLGLGGRAEGSMLPLLAGPGLGSERRGSDWGQRPARPASRRPLSLLYALWLRLAPPLPRCKGKASPGLPAWPYVTGQLTPADTWARPHLGTAPPGSQGALSQGPGLREESRCAWAWRRDFTAGPGGHMLWLTPHTSQHSFCDAKNATLAPLSPSCCQDSEPTARLPAPGTVLGARTERAK